MKIQLLTFPGCPHAGAARKLIERALASANLHAAIEAVDTTAPETPEHLRVWGSPTILIDGADIEGLDSPASTSCRLYRDSAGQLRGIPSEATVLDAVRRARTS